MEPITTELPGFRFVGIAARTTVADAADVIGRMWQRFISEKLIERIPEFTQSTILTVYDTYDVEGTDVKSFRALVGCRVQDQFDTPEGFVTIQVPAGKYAMFLARGQMPEALRSAWNKIDTLGLNRTYLADWDVFGPKSQNEELSEVEIYVSIS